MLLALLDENAALQDISRLFEKETILLTVPLGLIEDLL